MPYQSTLAQISIFRHQTPGGATRATFSMRCPPLLKHRENNHFLGSYFSNGEAHTSPILHLLTPDMFLLSI